MKVSFIVPVFNSGPFLTEAVNSIRLNASQQVELEILLVDDCSSDPETLAILSGLSSEPGVKIFRHEQNGGPSKARNTGLLAATGEWIAFLDSDDLLAPEAMKLRLQIIAAHPHIQWLAGDMLEMRSPGVLSHHKSFSVSAADGAEIFPGVFELKQPLEKLVTWGALPVLGSMMLRQELIKKIGLFDQTLAYGEDVCFCFEAAYYADLYWVKEPSLYLRRHHESMTTDKLRLATESPRYTRRLLGDPKFRKIHRQLRWQHAAGLRQSAKVSLAHDLRLQAIWAAMRSVAWAPNDMKSFRSLLTACVGETVKKPGA
jgi:glycosyltransferase involved in cell wall biosynthesis